VGRKTKLTPEVQDKIVQALGVGAIHEHACQYAGIDHATFYNWLKKGEEGRVPYVEFLDAVKGAEGKAVVGWLAHIETAARAGNWQAAAWKLERRYAKGYGRSLADADTAPPPDIHVHIHTARERLTTRLEHLSQRHGEDAAGVN
jgi:alpha-galactosidase/6-phospho-beta-glucosidase family protein